MQERGSGRGWARRGGLRRIPTTKRPSLREIPDVAIARAFLHDDRAVFEQILGHMRGALVLTCAAHVGSQAAEDVLQDVLLKIWQRRARYDPARSGFATWAVAIARNTAIDHRRALRRRETLLSTLARQVAAPAPLAEDTAIASEESRAVRAAAGTLSADQREAVFHAFWLDLSHSETASALSIPLGTAKSRVRLGLVRMQRALEADGLRVPAAAG